MRSESEIYRQKVWEFLDGIEPGIYFTIEKMCIPENRKEFVSAVKSYMDTKTPFQGNVTFNKDYSKIYKTNEIIFKEEIPKR